MILGFGSTEQKFEDDMGEKFRAIVAEVYADADATYFDSEMEKAVTKRLSKVADELKAKADEYKTAERFPDRYSKIWPNLLSNGATMVAVINFHHINRRHALSPDGWAMLSVEKAFVVHAHDLKKAEAA